MITEYGLPRWKRFMILPYSDYKMYATIYAKAVSQLENFYRLEVL